MEVEAVSTAWIVQARGRAICPDRKAFKLNVQILTRPNRERVGRHDANFHDIRRKITNFGDFARGREHIWQSINCNRDVAKHACLTRMGVRRIGNGVPEKLALLDPNAACATLPGCALLRNIDSVAPGSVEQRLIMGRPELLAVDAHAVFLFHLLPLDCRL
jgi:hypothetical protein